MPTRAPNSTVSGERGQGQPRVVGRDARGKLLADPTPGFTDAAPNIHTTEAPNEASPTPEDALWIALCAAPQRDGQSVIRMTGIPRATLYRHLREHVEAHRANQVGRGYWRARSPE